MSALDVISGTRAWHVEHSDCRAFLATLPDACLDACVCDPPYELGFMGKAWDATGIANDPAMWREVLRVLKPGAYLVAFSGTRTYHRMVCGIEDAGFEIRDMIEWMYGSGFPKSLNIGDGLGTALKPAHEPIVLARKRLAGTVAANVQTHGTGALRIDECRIGTGDDLNGGAYSEGERERGGAAWGNGVGGGTMRGANGDYQQPAGRWPANVLLSHSPPVLDEAGNVIADGCERVGERRVKGTNAPGASETKPWHPDSGFGPRAAHDFNGDDGLETVTDWRCVEGCPVRMLDEQSGTLTSHSARIERTGDAGFHGGAQGTGPREFYGDTGTASRFFQQFEPDPFIYIAKADRAEREAGCSHLPPRTGAQAVEREAGSAGVNNPRAGAGRTASEVRNYHPTVKPVALMRYLVRLVTPKGGIVLDHFTGSGTTGIAATAEGCRFIGCDMEAGHVEIARARIEGDAPLLNRQVGRVAIDESAAKVQPSLWGGL